jgi:hypothetical protein
MKTKPSNSTEKLYYISIDCDSHCEVTREGQGDWDGDDLLFDHSINGFVVVKEKDSWDFIVKNDPTGKQLELVYVLYSTAFHSEENRIELVGLYESYQDAKFVMDFIESDYRQFKEKDNYDYKPNEIVLPVSGKTEKIYTGTWKGYFEQLSEARIESVSDTGGRRVKFGY